MSWLSVSDVVTEDNLNTLLQFNEAKIRQIATNILAGQFPLLPFRDGPNKTGMMYTAYKPVMMFDAMMGNEYRRLKATDISGASLAELQEEADKAAASQGAYRGVLRDNEAYIERLEGVEGVKTPFALKRLKSGGFAKTNLVETPAGNFLTIVDYKSGKRTFDYTQAYAGLELQLMTYWTAMLTNADVLPTSEMGGAVFWSLQNPLQFLTQRLAEQVHDTVQNMKRGQLIDGGVHTLGVEAGFGLPQSKLKPVQYELPIGRVTVRGKVDRYLLQLTPAEKGTLMHTILERLFTELIRENKTLSEFTDAELRLLEQNILHGLLQSGDATFDIFTSSARQQLTPAQAARVMGGLTYENRPSQIMAPLMSQLFGNDLKASISRLENYAKNPFEFFLQYGLRLQERQLRQFHQPVHEFKALPDPRAMDVHEYVGTVASTLAHLVVVNRQAENQKQDRQSAELSGAWQGLQAQIHDGDRELLQDKLPEHVFLRETSEQQMAQESLLMYSAMMTAATRMIWLYATSDGEGSQQASTYVTRLEMTVETLQELLQAAFESAKYTGIPATMDQVRVSESGIVQRQGYHTVIVFGATSVNLPATTRTKALLPEAKDAREMARELYGFLTQIGIQQRLIAWRDAAIEAGDLWAAQQPEQVWRTFIGVLDDFVAVFDHTPETENYALAKNLPGWRWTDDTPWQFDRNVADSDDEVVREHVAAKDAQLALIHNQISQVVAPFLSRLPAVFARYEIPVFMDLDRPMGAHPLVAFLDKLFRLAPAYTISDVMGLLKTELLLPEDVTLADYREALDYEQHGIQQQTQSAPLPDFDVWQATTRYQEVEQMARMIRQEVASGKRRYRDFMLMTRDLGQYENILPLPADDGAASVSDVTLSENDLFYQPKRLARQLRDFAVAHDVPVTANAVTAQRPISDTIAAIESFWIQALDQELANRGQYLNSELLTALRVYLATEKTDTSHHYYFINGYSQMTTPERGVVEALIERAGGVAILLREHQDELVLYGSLLTKQGFISQFASQILELKQAGLTWPEVREMAENLSGQGTLQMKLQDLALIGNHIKFETEIQVLSRLAELENRHGAAVAVPNVQVFSLSRLAWYYMQDDPIYRQANLSATGMTMLVQALGKSLGPFFTYSW
ncbi:PD-(D/E)XK nuclease family protein [Weissella confusa]|uniref:PD-(D/E)XK nuclease family protein n=1 Tax=Weissella confusa TaxID=1583 RepID=A0A923SNX7_WEICO|nr:PD-(D/E)XK nuclease family protein [Weissella confusa]